MVLFELFGLGGVFGLVLGNNTLNDITNETDVDDGNGYREGVQIGEGKFGNDRTREHDSGGGREKSGR